MVTCDMRSVVIYGHWRVNILMKEDIPSGPDESVLVDPSLDNFSKNCISKLQPEGVCKHMSFLCFTDGIHLKHIYCSCITVHSMCLNTCEKKYPRGFYPPFRMIQKGSSPEISVINYKCLSCPFPEGRHLYPDVSHL